jgi:hypothetical protein
VLGTSAAALYLLFGGKFVVDDQLSRPPPTPSACKICHTLSQ